ncbi:unnamed protein product [Boreogadus saida]
MGKTNRHAKDEWYRGPLKELCRGRERSAARPDGALCRSAASHIKKRSSLVSLSSSLARLSVSLADRDTRRAVQNPVGPVFGIRKALLLCDWTDERKDSSDISCGCFNSDASLPRLCSQLPGHIRSNDEHGIAASL